MTGKKIVFVAFAIEGGRQRDFLKGQSLNTKSPSEYIDMSVKRPTAPSGRSASAPGFADQTA